MSPVYCLATVRYVSLPEYVFLKRLENKIYLILSLLQATTKDDNIPPVAISGIRSRRSLIPPTTRVRLKSPSAPSAATDTAAAAPAPTVTFRDGDKVVVSGVKPGVVRLLRIYF